MDKRDTWYRNPQHVAKAQKITNRTIHPHKNQEKWYLLGHQDFFYIIFLLPVRYDKMLDALFHGWGRQKLVSDLETSRPKTLTLAQSINTRMRFLVLKHMERYADLQKR